MKIYCQLFIGLLIIFLSFSVASGQTINQTNNKLTIGLRESPPFIINKNNNYSGLSIDLWEKIAGDLDIKYEYRYYYDLGQLIDAIAEGEVALSINPMTVTSERLQRFSFSQPYFISNLAIAVHVKESAHLMTFLKNFFSRQFLEVVILLFLIIFIFGVILWLVERRKNPEHFGKGIRGVGDGIWWSAVTMTTVGYGDKAPITGIGRIISIVWMFTAVIIISGFTASISAALTYNKFQTSISNIHDLRNVSVGTVKNSSSAEFLDDHRIKFRKFETLDMALEELNIGKLKAVVYDKPLLTYLINKKGYDEEIEIITSEKNPVYFSFSSSNDSLLKELNPLLIDFIESSEWDKILIKYSLREN